LYELQSDKLCVQMNVTDANIVTAFLMKIIKRHWSQTNDIYKDRRINSVRMLGFTHMARARFLHICNAFNVGLFVMCTREHYAQKQLVTTEHTASSSGCDVNV
jgi:hypothetical protein